LSINSFVKKQSSENFENFALIRKSKILCQTVVRCRLVTGIAGDIKAARSLLPTERPLDMEDDLVSLLDTDRDVSGVMLPLPDDSWAVRITDKQTSPGCRLCKSLWKSSSDVSFVPIPFNATTWSLSLINQRISSVI